jgi:hypothetical protein
MGWVERVLLSRDGTNALRFGSEDLKGIALLKGLGVGRILQWDLELEI